MAEDRTEAIRARLGAATPGPWRWWGNVDTRHIQLTTVDRGVLTIMAFRRWGMQGGAPAFFRRTPDMPWGWNGTQESVEDIAVREVSYRGDLTRLDNPNAELIANAPTDLAHLLGEVDRLREALRETDEMLWRFAGDGIDPNWRPLSVRERRRANAALLTPREVPDGR